MSVVACKILENGYEIAADSITARGWTQTVNNTKLSKLFEVNGMVIGGTGLSEELSLLWLFATSHRIVRSDELAVLEFLSEFSDWRNSKTDNASIDNSYIIGLDKKVFVVNDWNIAEVATYEAIGAGMDFALAALYLGHSVQKAVETAIELSVYCEAPVQVIIKNG